MPEYAHELQIHSYEPRIDSTTATNIAAAIGRHGHSYLGKFAPLDMAYCSQDDDECIQLRTARR